jgi:predicted nucleic acid-binding protein
VRYPDIHFQKGATILLVIDTNRIMAGLLRSSISRKIILNDNFSFYAPDYIKTELTKHREYLMKKARLTESDFDTILHMLLDKVCLVPFEEFEPEYSHALHIMEPVDADDTSFLAVGLALHLEGIRTQRPALSPSGSHESISYKRSYSAHLKKNERGEAGTETKAHPSPSP